jgi:hypothetical protein
MKSSFQPPAILALKNPSADQTNRLGGMLPVATAPLAAVVLALAASTLHASTLAYWRFEEGPLYAQVSHNGQPDGGFYGGTADSSGNGNSLSVYQENWAGSQYRSEVPSAIVPQTGTSNNFSIKNTGGLPGLYTDPSSSFSASTPMAFTIEASFKVEAGAWRAIVGRDGNFGNQPAMWLGVNDAQGLMFRYVDLDGIYHDVNSVANAITGFDYPSDPDGTLAPWYSAAAVSDGATLSIYLNNALVGSTPLGAGNTAMNAGFNKWTVGRGMYAGGDGDRGYGYIDEVRISDSALAPGAFLSAVPEPSVGMLGWFGAALLLRRRR